MPKQLQFSTDARTKLLAGAEKLAHAVRLTMGPKGRNVVLGQKYGTPIITNDGVTIAKDIDLPDPFESMGARLVKEAATKTNDMAGDGTTTATVLAYELIKHGLPLVREGANPVAIKNGIMKAVAIVVKELRELSEDVKDNVAHVATIASSDSATGELIAEVFKNVGSDGVITVEQSQTLGVSHEYAEGMQFDNGYISAHMVTDSARMEAVLEKPVIIMTDKKISLMTELIPLLEKIIASGKKNFLIIAEDVDGEALATLIVNKLRGAFQCVAVKAPGFGSQRKDLLQDIAILTGGKVITDEIGLKLEKAELTDVGSAAKVVISKDKTIIVSGSGKEAEISARKKQIKAQIQNTKSEFDQEKLKERLAKITGGVAIIRVGAATEVEATEKKHRVEDAVSSVRAALEEGIVPGGGMALYYAESGLKDALKGFKGEELVGAEIVLRALQSPLQQIVENAGKDFAYVALRLLEEKTMSKRLGYDADNDKVVDMVKAGIIDPTKVTRSALENAASVAAIFLTTGAAVVDIEEKEKATPPPY